MQVVNWFVFVSQTAQYTQLDLNAGSQTQAEWWLWGDVFKTDVVPVQTQRLQFGEISHIHNAAETAQRELYNHGTEWEEVMSLFLYICSYASDKMSSDLLQYTTVQLHDAKHPALRDLTRN